MAMMHGRNLGLGDDIGFGWARHHAQPNDELVIGGVPVQRAL